jgi:hypothetical protein
MGDLKRHSLAHHHPRYPTRLLVTFERPNATHPTANNTAKVSSASPKKRSIHKDAR